MPDFLLELGTEEIPAGYIQPALSQGAAFLKGYLDEHHLTYQDIKTYSTPRRMVFSVTGLPDKQADINKELSGPPCSVAFSPDGKPTQAYFGFIKKYGLKESDVKTKDTAKGKACYASVLVKGERSEKILADAVPGLVKSLPFPKSMWWEDKAMTFARPLRYIMAIFGAKPLKVNLAGVACGNKTFGHPFLSPKAIVIKSADFTKYQSALRKSKVIVDSAERRALIAKDIQKALDKYNAACNEPELLEEVTNLVEYPVAVECEFDESYLKLPAPVIESAMKSHQRYFPFKDKTGKLLNRFITVSNITANKEIKEGNERVIKARLSDALFFWEQDKKTPLEEYAKRLESIAFLGKLGTMKEKSTRLKELALFISEGWCDNKTKETIGRAAELCKADLLTGMVGEFPDLQGIMGYEYLKDKEREATASSEPEVALAIKEHYQPRFASDKLPASKTGICLSLAEKFDNITACFGSGLKPTGSSDPYGLRRQAVAIIDIIRSQNIYAISLNKTVMRSIDLLKSYLPEIAPNDLSGQISSFIGSRLISDYLDEGFRIDIINAVLSIGIDNIFKVNLRIRTIDDLSQEPVWNELVEVVERTFNITKNVKSDNDVNETLLKEKEEAELWNAYKENKDTIQKLIDAEQYKDASRLYHKVFAKPAHTFFEKVFVNVDDAALKNNRLTLLKKINLLYSSGIADLSRIPRK
ncbi:MAG TPA: glycine--tRNA ligase subunit beta [Planctomycetota bacterium]|nr:glycine--tRNA ligase subunit beta [Planctomycetota bacterium]